MDGKTVFLLLSIFLLCRETLSTPEFLRLFTNAVFEISCFIDITVIKVKCVEWLFTNHSQGNNAKVILRYTVEDGKVHYSGKIYENEFGIVRMSTEKKVKTVFYLPFLSSKKWHSGKYSCRYGVKKEKCSEASGREIVVEVFEQQFRITRCKQNEQVQMLFKGFNLSAERTPTASFYRGMPGQKPTELLHTLVYSNASNRAEGYYDITAKAVVPLTQIGKLPVLIACRVSRSNQKDDVIEEAVILKDQNISINNAVDCPPNIRMEKHPIWEVVGKTNLTLRCIFDEPQDKVAKIEWYRHDSTNLLMYNWTRRKKTSLVAPYKFGDSMATTLTIETASLNHTGNYTCNVTFMNLTLSALAVLVVYQLEPPTFTAIGCSNHKVRLECNASGVYPEPKITFSFSDPVLNNKNKLETDASSVKKINGLYEINVMMITQIHGASVDASLNISCHVVLSREPAILRTNWTTRKTYIIDSGGNTTDVCSPKVKMQQHLLWRKAYQTQVLMRCNIDIPLKDEIESVEWIYQNFSDGNIFYKWEKKTNNFTILGKYKEEILDSRSLIPGLSGGSVSSTLQLKNASFEYQGNYSCQVNYLIAGSRNDAAALVVYALEKPDYVKATRCSDNQTVGLECRANNIRPQPIDVAFYIKPDRNKDNSWTQIKDTDVYIDVTETNGYFAISARMIAGIQWFGNITPLQARCEVVLHDNISESESTDLADPDTSGNSECSPNVRADKRRLWEKVGEDVVLRCTFNIPFRRRISSVEWIRQNMSDALFKWEANGNRTKDRLNMSFTLTQDPGGRNVTTLTIESANIEHSGNYTCRINYGPPKSSQSDTSLLVVYRLSRLVFSAVGCNDEKVRLECMADSVHPAPLEVAFFFYDPTNDSLLKLNSTVPPKRRNETNGLYNMTAKMFTQLDLRMAAEMHPTFMCRMVLSWDPPIIARSFAARTTFVVDFRGVHVDVCSPKVTVEPHLRWVEFGTSPVVIHCRFDVPLNDEIESIEWFHQNTSALFNLSQAEGKITNASLIREGDKLATLKLDKANIKHNGSYLCRVNYVLAGNPSGYGHLVVYRIEKPYHFETTEFGEGEALLECKAGNLFPEPKRIVFFRYDPVSKLKTRFIEKPVSHIFKLNEFYNINAHITIETGESESVQYVCDVVLSEDPKIEESTLSTPPTTTTSYYTPDDYDKTNITGKGEISPKYIIIGGSIGGLLLGSFLAYLLYAYICKRLCHAWQDESSKEKKKKKKQ